MNHVQVPQGIFTNLKDDVGKIDNLTFQGNSITYEDVLQRYVPYFFEVHSLTPLSEQLRLLFNMAGYHNIVYQGEIQNYFFYQWVYLMTLIFLVLMLLE